jgi:hypothetical protein
LKPALPAFLFEPRQPTRTILLAWPLVTLPALGLAAFFSWLIPGAPTPVFDGDPWVVFFLIEVFAPIVESLIMAAVLEVLLRIFPWQAAVGISAIGWGVAHSLQAPTWGLVIWWPFLVFSILYVTWRRRSKLGAIAIAAAVHALNNLIPALLLLRAG